MKTISDKIFELLKEKGMSQKEFAQRTGIAESSKMQGAMPLSQLFEVLFDSSVVVKYPIF